MKIPAARYSMNNHWLDHSDDWEISEMQVSIENKKLNLACLISFLLI